MVYIKEFPVLVLLGEEVGSRALGSYTFPNEFMRNESFKHMILVHICPKSNMMLFEHACLIYCIL